MSGNDVSSSLARWVLALDSAPLPITSTRVAEAPIALRDPRIDPFIVKHPRPPETPNRKRKSVPGTNLRRHGTSSRSWVMLLRLPKALRAVDEDASESPLTRHLLVPKLLNNNQNVN